MFTADNSTALNQAAPTDVRAGVAYGISNSQTGRLTVPARGSVALSVNYGPSMPFTATRSGTTATATLAYSYPLVVGDQITVTGASNSEWNSTYTIASVVSGTSVTFVVPATHSATAGTGALMQATGTAVLDPAAVASAVWGAASRTITGGVVDTATTLTNSPTVPTPAEIRAEMDSSSTKLANLDATVSSRLATSGYTAPTSAPSVADIRTELAVELGRLDASVSSRLASASYTAPTTPPTAAQIATAVEGSLLNEADGQAVLNALVGAIGNTNLSEVSLVAAVRADLERTGGKLDSIPTSSAPSASSVAGAVRTELGVELGRIDASVSSRLAPSGTLATVTNLTNAPASVTPSDIWSHASRTLTTSSGPTAVEIRQEMDANSTKLDAAISSRLAASAYTTPTGAPTAAQNASAVRSELATELGRIDSAISSRLASASYTAPTTPPTAAQNASAVRTELSTELSRVDAAISSRMAASEASKLDSIKGKTDLLNTDRLSQVATTNIVGVLLAQANS